MTDIYADKRIHLVSVPDVLATGGDALSESLTAWAADLAHDLGRRALVGVVVNSLGRARRVDQLLRRRGHRVVLATGLRRAADPEVPIRGVRGLVVTTHVHDALDGAGLDGLVTESASWEALVRWLARVNRTGAPVTGRAVVVHDEGSLTADPLHGPARLHAWRLLTRLTDVGPSLPPEPGSGQPWPTGLPASPAALSALLAALPRGEREALAATAPPPELVRLTWRELPRDLAGWRVALEQRPPQDAELATVPVGDARRWLAAGRDGARLAMRWRAGEAPAFVRADRVVAGDVIVVRSDEGGYDDGGWAPSSTTPVAEAGAGAPARRGKREGAGDVTVE